MVKEKYEKGEKKPDSKRETWDSLKEEGNKLFSHRKYDQGMEFRTRWLERLQPY